MPRCATVILAAGLGTRMKSTLPKVLHLLLGAPILSYPLQLARNLNSDPICVVIPPKQKGLLTSVRAENVSIAIQQKPLGTGHAVKAAEKALAHFKGYLLVLYGDVPLLRAETVEPFMKEVEAKEAVLGLITMQPPDPGPYGRILRDLDGQVVSIVEAKEASAEQRSIREVNTGVYCVDKEWLFRSLRKLRADNAKQEYYLTDILSIAVKEGQRVVAHQAVNAEEFLGINTRVDLARVMRILRQRIHERHMLNGVTLLDEAHTYIDALVEIGQDTTIAPGVSLLGKTRIGKNCTIETGVVLQDALLKNDVQVKALSVIEKSKLEEGAVVGPFARIRPESIIGKRAKVGNFVEVKRSHLMEGAKASHLSYLGDATIGKEANIGCGTITCNYDGVEKHRTVIGEKAFIGSDTQLVAPVKIGRGATIGAGATITKNVPPNVLALSRVPQVIVKGWKRKKKGKR